MLPTPTIDHVVINVQDRLDEALETYRRLGFTMTPRGYHARLDKPPGDLRH